MSHIYNKLQTAINDISLVKIVDGISGYIPIFTSDSIAPSNLWAGLQDNTDVTVDFDHIDHPLENVLYYNKQFNVLTLEGKIDTSLISDVTGININCNGENSNIGINAENNVLLYANSVDIGNTVENRVIVDDTLRLLTRAGSMYIQSEFDDLVNLENGTNTKWGVMQTDANGKVTIFNKGFGVFNAGNYTSTLSGPIYSISNYANNGNNGKWVKLGKNITTNTGVTNVSCTFNGTQNFTITNNIIFDELASSFQLVSEIGSMWRIRYYGLAYVVGNQTTLEGKIFNINLGIGINGAPPGDNPGEWASTNIVLKDGNTTALDKYQTPITGQLILETDNTFSTTFISIWASLSDLSNTLNVSDFRISSLRVVFEQLSTP